MKKQLMKRAALVMAASMAAVSLRDADREQEIRRQIRRRRKAVLRQQAPMTVRQLEPQKPAKNP